MEFHTETIDGVLIVEIPGENLDADNSQELKQDLSAVIEAHPKIVFDMGQLRFVDSSGCGAILSCFKKIKSRGGELKLIRLQDRVLELFKLMRLERIFDIFQTKEDAVNAFGSK
jgi:anti-sigma B factor antagonist